MGCTRDAAPRGCDGAAVTEREDRREPDAVLRGLARLSRLRRRRDEQLATVLTKLGPPAIFGPRSSEDTCHIWARAQEAAMGVDPYKEGGPIYGSCSHIRKVDPYKEGAPI